MRRRSLILAWIPAPRPEPESTRALERLAEASLRLTPRVALRRGRAPQALFLKLEPGAGLESPDLAARRLLALSRRLSGESTPRWACGETAGLALARACRAKDSGSVLSSVSKGGSPASLSSGPPTPTLAPPASAAPFSSLRSSEGCPPDLADLPVRALAAFRDPFALETAPEEGGESADARRFRTREWPQFLERLRRLGVETLGQLARLPRDGVGTRWEPWVLDALDALEGRALEPWPGFQPPERMQEEAELDPECAGAGEGAAGILLEGWLFATKGMLDRICARLRGRSLRLAGLELELGARFRLRLELPVSQGSALGVLPILRDRLEGALRRDARGAEGATKLRLRVTETVPGRSGQRDFFDGQAEEAQERLSAVWARLHDRLGGERVFRARLQARHAPERAWTSESLRHRSSSPSPSPSPSSPSSSSSWSRLARPTRLLANPTRIRVLDGWIELGGAAAVFSVGSGGGPRRWRSLAWEGPERIGADWWSTDPVARADATQEASLSKSPPTSAVDRDYYRVRTENGPLLWIYRAGGAFYLHGYFD